MIRPMFRATVAAAMLFACAMPAAGVAETTVPGATCDAMSLDSVPGQQWSESYGWRYDTSTDPDPAKRAADNLANRAKAYTALVTGQSPWPDWFVPDITLLQPGTLFQMAMSPAAQQPDDRPGGFGTFDDIVNVAEVREDLAVLQKWKPDVSRVNTYRVTEILPVHVGPIGPQVDPDACELLPGRYSQFEMLVPREDRMHYLELVSTHPLDPG